MKSKNYWFLVIQKSDV